MREDGGGSPTAAPSAPQWANPKVLRDAVFEMHTTVTQLQEGLAPIAVPDLDNGHAEALVSGIDTVIGQMIDAMCANSLRLAIDVGATVDAVVAADRGTP